MYDFIVRTEHSTRLWVNDMKKPLIDRAVKSGSDTEFRGSIYLLGGRAYPLKLEFSRGSVGVRKDPKDKLQDGEDDDRAGVEAAAAGPRK